MKKKYTNYELLKMDAIEVYKLVLIGKVSRFPAGFWERPDALENAKKCTKFLIEDILNISEEELKEKLNTEIFKSNKLYGMIQYCFNCSSYQAIVNAYPERNYKPWDFKSVPHGYWNIDTGILATKWLLEEHLKLDDKQIKEQLNLKLFKDNGLNGMLYICFNSSPYECINKTYPEKNYKPWEFNYVPINYWTKETGIQATKWLIETKLKLNEEQLKEQLSAKLFKDNGLYSMLSICFNGSSYECINTTYPERNYKPWDFKNTPLNYWKNKDNSIMAIKWLIEEHLKLSEEELKSQLSQKFFNDNGFSGMLMNCFNGSPYDAITITYPEKNYKPWEFKHCTPNKYWNRETGINATKWLIKTKLKLTDEEVKKQLSLKMFKENGLWGMLLNCFNGSHIKAIIETYPNKFKIEDFK